MTNIEIAQLISERIGQSPIPHNDIRNISYEIYQELGGESELDDFEDIYELLLTILPMAREGGIGIIDDTSVRTDKTWSSNKINSELSDHYTKTETDTLLNGKQGTLTAGENIDITNDTISAIGYKFNGDELNQGGFAEKYRQDAADGGQVVENTATGLGSHAEGYGTTASGGYGSHTEGNLTQALGPITHAEGNLTKAYEIASHAEGCETEAKANYSHAEGYKTKAIGVHSHSEGGWTKAKGMRAHAEGEGSTSVETACANGDNSHTEGCFTQTQNFAEHAQGAANVSHKTSSNAATSWVGDGNHTLHSIGNGRYLNTQSNAVEVMQNADVYIKGVGGYDGVHIKSEAGYETVKTLQQVIKGKQDVLTAGQNIVITNNTISAVIDAGFHVEVVQTLPTTGEVNTIYFVPKAGGENPDVYDEYMYINSAWEKIGSTEVDLSNYYNKTEVDGLLAGKQATLTAGNNITINGTTISANDTTYSAGANIAITNNTIKAEGYTYNPTTGAFAEGDRDIDDSGAIRTKPSATGIMAHAEGTGCSATGRGAHAEGSNSSATGIISHAEGSSTTASANNSHAEGSATVASANNAHSEGRISKATGFASHAEGNDCETGGNYTTNTKTAGDVTDAGAYAHAEGNATIALGIGAHSEGKTTFAKGNYSHAEGNGTRAQGAQSHAEGGVTTVAAAGANGHAEGRNTTVNGYASHAEGDTCETGGNYSSNTTNPKTPNSRTAAAGDYSHAEGNATIAYGIASHSEGKLTFAKGDFSHTEGLNTSVTVGGCGHAEGNGTKVQGGASHAEGQETIASGYYCHSEGYKSKAQGNGSHAEGNSTTAQGDYSHTEGYQTKASGGFAHAEGVSTQALSAASHAEGSTTKTAGDCAHAEGYNTETGGNYTSNTKTAGVSTGAGAYAHAEGNSTIANGVAAHSEGRHTLARAGASHAEGAETVTNGGNSHAEGRFTQTLQNAEHAQGSYNKSHTDDTTDGFGTNGSRTIHSIGIGTANDARKNAVEVMQNGDAYLLGVGNYDGIHIKGETGAPSGLQTLQEVVRGKQDTLGTGDNIEIQNNTITALGYEFNPSYNSVTNGDGCYAEGAYSHAEGLECITGQYALAAHTEGVGTEAFNINEHAQGRYNVSHIVAVSESHHEGNTVVSVGIGEDGERRNAFEIMQNGDIYVYGLGYYDGTATKSDNPDIMTLQDILKKIADAVGVDIGALF